ncbi:MAG: hypothetical protein LCH84_07990 [Gemmatimonadetes bacterium]|nr:hypothetical protein [Gemmatimonadota bacterium]
MDFTKLRFLGATMLGAYLVLNTLMLLLRPFTQGMSPFLSTALLVPPMVLAMVYAVIPLARRAGHARAQ